MALAPRSAAGPPYWAPGPTHFSPRPTRNPPACAPAQVLAWSKRTLGSTLTNFVIRHSFYKQFVAGESVQACRAAIEELRRWGVGGITECAGAERKRRPGGAAARVPTAPLPLLSLCLRRRGCAAHPAHAAQNEGQRRPGNP